jgi:hypothetical protein
MIDLPDASGGGAELGGDAVDAVSGIDSIGEHAAMAVG